jgi:hypothetical protein
MYINSLSKNSRVWIYQSDRPFSNFEKNQILADLSEFTASWTSHGAGLSAKAVIIENYFIALAVDESVAGASGCSIDSSVRCIQAIGERFSIDFFNRLKLVVTNEKETKLIAFSDLETYSGWNIYDTQVDTVDRLNTSFLIPVTESELFKLLK